MISSLTPNKAAKSYESAANAAGRGPSPPGSVFSVWCIYSHLSHSHIDGFQTESNTAANKQRFPVELRLSELTLNRADSHPASWHA